MDFLFPTHPLSLCNCFAILNLLINRISLQLLFILKKRSCDDLLILELQNEFYYMSRLPQKKLKSLAKKYGIDSLGVFGSRARGDAHDNSDLDLLVTFKKPIGLFQFIRIQREMSEELGMKVDLVTQNSLNHRIKSYVMGDLRKIL